MEFYLIEKKIIGKLDQEEEKLFNEWLYESEDHFAYFERVQKNYWQFHQQVNSEVAWVRLSSKIERTNKQHWPRYAAAVAFILLALLPFTLKEVSFFSNNHLSPGSDQAILTLETGEKIELKKGVNFLQDNRESNGEQLVYHNESRTSNIEIKYNILEIPKGGKFLLQLSDQTKVWVNSESRLRYPVQFPAGKTREVTLEYGEAYFEVTSSDQQEGRGFHVKTKEQTVQVLGTVFNIKAYPEDTYITTTLVEGEVSIGLPSESIILAPNEQLHYDLVAHTVQISNVDVYNEISWRKGIFSFHNKPLEEIMGVLGRWYDGEIIFEDSSIKQLRFTGVLKQDQPIKKTLEIIKSTQQVNFEIDGRNIILKNKERK